VQEVNERVTRVHKRKKTLIFGGRFSLNHGREVHAVSVLIRMRGKNVVGHSDRGKEKNDKELTGSVQWTKGKKVGN